MPSARTSPTWSRSVPLDLDDLAALRDLTAPDEPRPLPRPGRESVSSALRTTGDAARSVRRSRVASYAVGAAVAGLLCGLIGPSPAALAQPLAAVVRGTLVPVASGSPVTDPGSDGATPDPADPAAAAAPVAPAPASSPSTHEQAQPRTAAEALAAVAGAIPAVLAPTVPETTPAWVPTRPLPARSGEGRRIVYAQRAAHVWIVGADGEVLRDYKVTGRPGRPRPGTYHVFSMSPTSANPKQKLRFDLMVRFARGVTGAAIGFHTIPVTYGGVPIQKTSDLGRAVGSGGCVRQSRADAEWLYGWVEVGDTVVVLR